MESGRPRVVADVAPAPDAAGGAEVGRLVARSRAGDRAAFESLYLALEPRVRLFFWKRETLSDVDDLTQGVFVSLFRALTSGGGPAEDSEDSLLKYLRTMARNALHDRARRRRVRSVVSSLDALFGGEDSASRGSAAWQDVIPADRSRGEREESLTRTEWNAIWDCIGGLEALARSLFWLHYVEDRSKREIARDLGRPESSVRAALVAAQSAVARCLAEKGIRASDG